MGHNFVLLSKGTDVQTFAMQAMEAMDNDYIPESDAIIAYTRMLGGGESDTISFAAPPKGRYPYLCSFPGHSGIMKGDFFVMD